ncbi:mitotic spindle assembly checkpoint protein MAD1-like [Amphibalanus amphitrite]|uniref:mitotic spindle assembly checkpoint protein MAD1-like n=1 Tax=Amphibalanus amphitrite TaxID=1232801 RepID=UPI001C9077CF|nr:mitotic spindle assembly checkpoint protein MAD1-like [Amphibalanus amphitrite]XP_043212608.1 mitotic spindle assembly checkpoint protein MAD1-like [Amphibalanus amphitrite]
MASPLGSVAGISAQKRPASGSLLPPVATPGGVHSLSTVSRDGSGSAAGGVSQEKRVRLDPERLSYENQLRKQAAALIDSQTQVTRLQAKLQSLDAQQREARVQQDTERHELTRRMERAEKQASEASAELKRQRQERARLESELTETRARLQSYRTDCDRDVLTARQRAEEEMRKLTEDLSETRRQLSEALSQLAEADTARQGALLLLEQERAQAAAADQRAASDGGLEREQLRAALRDEQMRVKELENQLASSEESLQLGSLMRERLARYPELEKQHAAMEAELRSLRNVVDKTLVLEERAAVLQKKADRFDQLQTELETARTECSEWRLQLATWREAAGDGVTCPDDLSRLLADLRKQQLLLKESGGTARAELSAAESRCQTLQTELDKLKEAQAEHDQTKLEGQVQLRKLQRKLTLVTMERDSCKRVLDAYESETTESLTSIERQRGEDRERLISTYRQQVESLERQLQEAASSGKLVFGSADSEARAELSTLRTEHEQLRKQLQQLQLEKEGLEAQLEERALRGDYNPATSRVLTLRDNPAAAAGSRRAGQLERLQQENAELRGRLEVLGDGAGSGLSQDAAKQISGLRSQLRASELRTRRLKEVFGRSTQEYRQSVCQLTGYKINADDTQLRLRSVYAPQQDQTLLFQRGAGDTIQLLENGFSARLSDLVEQYLYRQDSMPGFLAALTLRLLRDGPPAAPARAAARAPVRPPPPDDDDDCEIVELD